MLSRTGRLSAALFVVSCSGAPGVGPGEGSSGDATASSGGVGGDTTTTAGSSGEVSIPTSGAQQETSGASETGDVQETSGGAETSAGEDVVPFPIDEWSWHDVPGAICANGSATGIGVNQGTDDRLVIYMSGGSACLDAGCSIGTPSMRKDGGFGAAELELCVAGDCDGGVTFPSKSVFDRSSAVNPLADATYVFISNCAGDYYVGDNEHEFPGWTAQFHGWRNQGLFAAELAAIYPETSRIVLSGGSAGAVGAMLNYWRWVDAFLMTGARVDLVSDSFAFVFEDGPEWRYALHNPQVPPGCATCASDYRTVYEHNAGLAPGSRIAVIDSEDNWTLDLATFYKYTGGLEALQPLLDGISNLRYYVASGDAHILMQHPLDSDEIDVERDGEEPRYLSEFLMAMQSDDPAWHSVSCLGP